MILLNVILPNTQSYYALKHLTLKTGERCQESSFSCPFSRMLLGHLCMAVIDNRSRDLLQEVLTCTSAQQTHMSLWKTKAKAHAFRVFLLKDIKDK